MNLFNPTPYRDLVASSPIGKISDWLVDSMISSFLFWHYLPGNILTGTQPQWNLLFEPTRASLGPWIGSGLCLKY